MSLGTDTVHATRFKAAAGALVIAFAAVACNGTATNAPSQPAAASQPVGASQPAAGSAVSIVDFAFNPGSITVAAGGSVTWTNTSGTGHTVTADDGSFDSSTGGTSATIAGGGTFSHTFTTAGTFTYKCKIHSSMTGTVVVTP